MTKRIAPAAFAVHLFLLGTGLAFARHPKVASDLEGKPASATVDIIVQFNSVPGAATRHRVSARGGILKTDLGGLKAGAYSITAGVLESLANDPDIAYISPDRAVRGMLDHSVAAINALAPANLGMTGLGIGVAEIDSGITQDADLTAGRVLPTIFNS